MDSGEGSMSSRGSSRSSRGGAPSSGKKPQLSPGWIVRYSKTYNGKLYYFNSTTGATSWERPTLIYNSSPTTSNRKFILTNQEDDQAPLLLPATPTTPTKEEATECVNETPPVSPVQSEDDEWMEVEDEDQTDQLEEDIEMLDVTSKEILTHLHKPVRRNQNSIHVVVDTNILIHHLQFLDELMDTPLRGCSPPVIVLPYVVLHELDSIKNRKRDVYHQASEAIRYIHGKVSGGHPRIKGEIGELFDDAKNADDKVLHCALQMQLSGNCVCVVLLTDDKNLVVKSIVQGVQAHTARDFYEHYTASEIKLDELIAIEEIEEKIDAILCSVKTVLKRTLKVFVEMHITQAFGNNFAKFVSIPPPWTLVDLLDLLSSHWLSIFELTFCDGQRDTLKTINRLCSQLTSNKSSTSNSVKCLRLVNDSLQLIMDINQTTNTGIWTSECDFLTSLRDHLKLTLSTEDHLKDKHDQQHRSNKKKLKKEQLSDATKRIVSNLKRICCVINDLTIAVLDSLERPHSFTLSSTNGMDTGAEATPAPAFKCETLSFFPKLFVVAQKLKLCLQRVNNCSVYAHDFRQKTYKLFGVVNTAISNLFQTQGKSKDKISLPEKMSFEEFHQFCSDKTQFTCLLREDRFHLDTLFDSLHFCGVSISPKDLCKGNHLGHRDVIVPGHTPAT